MSVVIAVAGTGVRALVSVLVCVITRDLCRSWVFDHDYVIDIMPAIAAIAGGKAHCRYHDHQGRGGSVNVHSLCFLG